MEFFKKIKEMFFPSTETQIRRANRKKYLADRKNVYDMPEFRASNFTDASDLDLYVVAFNNLELIEYQIKLIKKYLQGKFMYIVVDNSNKKDISEKIRALCTKENVSYFKVYKAKKIRGTYSASHAMAMNWAYDNIIKSRQNNFAMIDHDIYPTREVDPTQYLKDKVLFGATRERHHIYFLWAGFAFFRWDFVKDKNLDFGRLTNFWGKHIADSGSANWKPIYQYYDRNLLKDVDYKYFDIYKEEFISGDNEYKIRLERAVEYMHKGEWLHLQGASGWHDVGNKNSYGFKLLDDLLSKE